MIKISYYIWSLLFFFLYIYGEIFSNIIYYSIFKNTKNYAINYSKKIIKDLNVRNVTYVCNWIILLTLLSLKINFSCNLILPSVMLLAIMGINLQKYIKNTNSFVIFNVMFILLLFSFTNNFVIFFLFLELYSIIFYFFFITKNQKVNTHLLQQKNMLLLYLFNNFLSTITHLLGLYYIVYFYGTLNFTELKYLHIDIHWQIYFLIISFLLKLSLPGFHILKVEVYKYMSTDVVILYSILSLYITYIFIIFIFDQNIIYLHLIYYKFFNIIIIFGVLILIHQIKINNLNEFIAYSGFSTTTLVVINYIV